MRVVSLFLPDWPIDRLRRAQGAAPEADAGGISPDAPLVLVQRFGNRRLVYAANAAARAAGLRPGMAVAQAQALVPELGLREAELEADAAALEKLALWALRRYSPLVAVDPPDGLVIDATGAAHLQGGEEAMLHDMVARLAASGIQARAAHGG